MATGGSSRGLPDGITQDEHKEMVKSTNQFRESVVRIIGVKQQEVVETGSAFRVYNGDLSLFLTCDHNFSKDESIKHSIRLYPGDKKNYPVADILWRSEEHDLLLFSVKSVPKRNCLELSTEQVKEGDRVVLLAYVSPTLTINDEVQELVLVNDPAPLTGVVVAPPFEESKNKEKIWVTCEATPGVSGSPLMFKNGKVIGVCLASDKGWREAVSANTVLQLLREWLGMSTNNKSTFAELFKLAALTGKVYQRRSKSRSG